jgi:hypothetical protein
MRFYDMEIGVKEGITMGRPPLTDQERAQIRALVRFLIIVLLAIAVASASVAVFSTIFLSGDDAALATASP